MKKSPDVGGTAGTLQQTLGGHGAGMNIDEGLLTDSEISHVISEYDALKEPKQKIQYLKTALKEYTEVQVKQLKDFFGQDNAIDNKQLEKKSEFVNHMLRAMQLLKQNAEVTVSVKSSAKIPSKDSQSAIAVANQMLTRCGVIMPMLQNELSDVRKMLGERGVRLQTLADRTDIMNKESDNFLEEAINVRKSQQSSNWLPRLSGK